VYVLGGITAGLQALGLVIMLAGLAHNHPHLVPGEPFSVRF
jgi:hypothetical protein